MTITIIHPSRSRPEQAYGTMLKWLTSAKDGYGIEYILSVDSDEPQMDKYIHAANLHNVPTVNLYNIKLLVNDNKSAIEAINNAAKVSTGDLLLVVSDDFSCPYHWDAALIEALEGKRDFLVKVDDGAQPWIPTLPIMDRKYYERFGYIYHPDYVHLFADTEAGHVAHMLGRVIELPIKFPHNHYTTGKVKRDEINVKNDATWQQGEKLYLQRLMRNFDLPPEQVLNYGNFDNNHRRWLASKGITYA